MVSVEATSQPDVRIDARPILPVSTATVWDEAIRVRDRLAAVIAATLADERCEALLLTSQAGNYPAWIRLEAWLPDPAGQPGVHERSELELIVDTKPFNKHSLVYTARLTRGKRSLALVERTHFSDADMAEWTRHAIGGGGKPSRYRPRLDALRQSIGIFIPPLRPRHNPIARTFRNRLFDGRLLAVLILLAAATAALLHPPLLAPVAIGVGALSLLAFVLMRFVVHRYRRHDWVVPQPREAPPSRPCRQLACGSGRARRRG